MITTIRPNADTTGFPLNSPGATITVVGAGSEWWEALAEVSDSSYVRAEMSGVDENSFVDNKKAHYAVDTERLGPGTVTSVTVRVRARGVFTGSTHEAATGPSPEGLVSGPLAYMIWEKRTGGNEEAGGEADLTGSFATFEKVYTDGDAQSLFESVSTQYFPEVDSNALAQILGTFTTYEPPPGTTASFQFDVAWIEWEFDWTPAAAGVDPDTGTELGGTDVTITQGGASFDETWKVYFGTKDFPATNIVVVDPETITCRTPAHTAGLVDVVVYTGSDPDTPDDSVTFEDAFTFTAAPAYAFPFITSIVPDEGTTLGGTSVTINGGNFVPGMSVFFDGIPATSVAYVSDAIYTCVTPQHQVESIKVTMSMPA